MTSYVHAFLGGGENQVKGMGVHVERETWLRSDLPQQPWHWTARWRPRQDPTFLTST